MTRRKFLIASASGFVIIALGTSFAGYRSAPAIGPDEQQAELANAMNSAKVSLRRGFTASDGKASRFPENLRSRTANSSFPSIPQRTETSPKSSSIT